jgi:broad specificity phosphatase PhoE
VEPGLDEIRAGDFDGRPIGDYWSWKERHARDERLPHGESVEEALLRYADALRRLLSRTEAVTLLVVHEFALRQIAEAATTSSSPRPRGLWNGAFVPGRRRGVVRACLPMMIHLGGSVG